MRKRPWSSVTTIFAYLVGRSSVSAITQTPACGFAGPRLATPRTTPLMLLVETFEGADFLDDFFAPAAFPAATTRMTRRIVVLFIVRDFYNIRPNQASDSAAASTTSTPATAVKSAPISVFFVSMTKRELRLR